MQDRIRIIADCNIPSLKGVLEPFADVEYLSPNEITKEKVAFADALLIRSRTVCDKNLLAGSAVKFIATATIGFDHIDAHYCDSNNIKWISAPGCNSGSVQQYIASVLVTLAIKKNFNLPEKTIGIVGVGNVGRKVERLAKVLGLKVLLNDPPRERIVGSENFVSLEKLVSESDIITFHVPLNKNGVDKTFHLADEEFFEMFGGHKTLINSSRGEVVKNSALKSAIRSGKVEMSALDVWESEPAIDFELMKMVDIATPHIAGYSADGKANGTAICVNGLADFFTFDIVKNWYPSMIPEPDNSKLISLKTDDKDNSSIVADYILSTYNVLEDDKRLRNSGDTFEKQREEYPVRREFSYYNIEVSDANESFKEQLLQLGFNFK